MLRGIGASNGIGIGKIVIIPEQKIQYESIVIQDKTAEINRYRKASASFCEKIMHMAGEIKEKAGRKEAQILEGHVIIVEDPVLAGEVETLIHKGKSAESAFDEVCRRYMDVFLAAQDELTNQRAQDLEDIRIGLLNELLGIKKFDIGSVLAGSILLAKNLAPSMTAEIRKENIAGIITEIGGTTSHTAILARAMEIPAVLNVENACGEFKNGDCAVIDGTNGIVIKNPVKEEIEFYTNKKEEEQKEREELKKYLNRDTKTKDGISVDLLCNIGNPEEAEEILKAGAEGVGLFRTELLFMEKDLPLEEEEQFEAYKKAALGLKGRPVIIRTLDIGGDKKLPYLGMEKEENPFLGFRAVRFCLKNPLFYKQQLRALLRASVFGDIRIMIPMITGVEEIRGVKVLIQESKEELKREGIPYKEDIPIGIMMETPSAALTADLLAEEVDFFSIGTNDLTQYTLAVDRGNAKAAYLYSSYHPALLRFLQYIIRCAVEKGIPAGICGEAAGDPLLIPVLLSFGLKEFSVSPSSVLNVKKEISRWSKEEADSIAHKALEFKTESEVKEFLIKVLTKK